MSARDPARADGGAVTQTLLADLASQRPFVRCLALFFIANLGNAEVSRSAAAADLQKPSKRPDGDR
jgi:hypothetical protein